MEIAAVGEDYKFLKENEELVKQVLIVSELCVDEDETAKELKVEVAHADGQKCERCWKYDVHTEDGLCPRCKEVLGK